MNCQNCEALVPPNAERCEKCGAKLLSRRVIFGVPRNDEFSLTAEEEPIELDQVVEDDELRFPPPGENPPPSPQPSHEAPVEFAYGGFIRRLGAFMIDLTTISLLCALMGFMAYVGYKVGLTAHERSVSFDNAAPFFVLLSLGWLSLSTAYFVLFHGMEGRTVGKWLIGLRVVGEERQAISYRRALLRWIAWLGFGLATFGLSFLWILWSREKRAGHDFLARTWVIRG